MRESVLLVGAAIAMCYLTSRGGGKKTEEAPAAAEATTEAAAFKYKLMTDLPTVDITTLPKDKGGRCVTLDGKVFNGWRDCDRADVPGAQTIEDGVIRINGSGTGEVDASNGGNLAFTHKLGNFELGLEWKVSKGSNSGAFIMIQEVEGRPFYISAPKY